MKNQDMWKYLAEKKDKVDNNPEATIFTDKQVEQIAKMALKHNPDVSEEECYKLVKWCEQAVISHELVELIFKGKVSLGMQGNEPVFTSIITKKGKK